MIFATRAAALVAAASLPQQDSTTIRLPPGVHAADSVVAGDIDYVTPIVQFIFQQPPWLMWTGVAIAAVLAGAILWYLWGRREAIVTWFRTRSRGTYAAMGAGAAAMLAIATFAGFKSFDFMMNDKRFCNGCHIFVPSGQVWERPDSGDYTLVNKLEGKHDTINCHTCHAFRPVAEGVKMVMWMSGVRDEEVPPHGKVPRQTCENCHISGAAKESWQAIASTGGHKFHMESDSVQKSADVARKAEFDAIVARHGSPGHADVPKPGDGIECLTCHARSAHRFQPADSTCSQQGCHLTEEIDIRLGKMSEAQGLHCNACHQFTKVLPQLADVDSARGTLRPGSRQCFSCHEMRQALASFDLARDPHKGSCGMCHNPHTNVKPADAQKTCADAGCHADWRGNDFHMGAAHVKVAQKCETCHAPHAAKVDAADCTGCHDAVAEGARKDPTLKRKPRVPEVFDTTKALQRRAEGFEPRTLHGKGDAPPEDPPAAQSHDTVPAAVPARALAADPRPFDHDQHKPLKCITCHDVKSRENKVNFAAPRGCLICHHEAPQTTRDCAACHSDEQVRQFQHKEALRVKVMKADVPARTRTVEFRHATHENVKCADCHVAKVTLAPKAEAKDCTGCHDNHHEAKRDCANCHRTEESWKAHTRESHVACTECHAQATVSRLLPDRSFCLGCHPPAVDHYADQECTQCHLLTSPEEFRPRLSSAP